MESVRIEVGECVSLLGSPLTGGLVQGGGLPWLQAVRKQVRAPTWPHGWLWAQSPCRSPTPQWDRGRGLGQLRLRYGTTTGCPARLCQALGLAVCVIVSGCGVSGFLSVIVRPWSKLGLLSHRVVCLSVKSVSERLCFKKGWTKSGLDSC